MNKPIISIIAAMNENRIIGNQGKIPWHIKDDLIRFRDKTINHTVIMGRKSFDYMLSYYQKSGNNLPKRTHIIVTKNPEYRINLPNIFICSSIEKALEKGKEIEPEEIFIAGGAQIFAQTINLVDKLYLTIVQENFSGDSYFPDYKNLFTKKIMESEWKNSNNHIYKFLDLARPNL